jgi:hypothetical protein
MDTERRRLQVEQDRTAAEALLVLLDGLAALLEPELNSR